MIAIIDDCGANINSLKFAFKRLGHSATLTKDPDMVEAADFVILPGVGHAKSTMQALIKNQLATLIPRLQQPVLEICSGMQVLFEKSDEGETQCLGIFPGKVESFTIADRPLPHMGWNQLQFTDGKSCPLLIGVEEKHYVYFIHNYLAKVDEYTLATCHYGQTFSAIVQHKNFYGMQFHPEKSGKIGSLLLKNFLAVRRNDSISCN